MKIGVKGAGSSNGVHKSGHGLGVERHHMKLLCFGLQELLELPTLISLLQPRKVRGSRGNEPHRAFLGVPRLVAHGIEERHQRIIFNCRRLGQRLGKPTILAAGLHLGFERVYFGPQLWGQTIGCIYDNHNVVK